jgi:outer membrane immunogenic protein
MRKLFAAPAIVALTPILGLMLAVPAAAADLRPAPAAYKAPPPVPAFSWTGAYAGVSVGARFADTTWNTTAITLPPGPPDPTSTPASFDSTTARVGGYLGYNWQVAPLWVAGAEADFAWGRNDKTRGGIPGTFGPTGLANTPAAATVDSSNVKPNWDGSLRARVGYTIAPNWLLYATGGLAFQQADLNAACTGAVISWCITARNETDSTTQLGWTIGGGVEAAVTGNWLMRAEYRYADYGNIDHTFFTGTIDQVVMHEALKTHTALLGLAYKFGY